MNENGLRRRLPGYVASGLLIVVTCFWTMWGVGELFYEGWGQPVPSLLTYLLPALILLAITALTLTWPRVGGWLLIAVGTLFGVWWTMLAAARGWLSLGWILRALLPFAGALVFVGVLFLLESRHRRQRRLQGRSPPGNWVRRNSRYVVGVGPPCLVALFVSIYFAPIVVTRFDDGFRSERLIEGNGVTLVWAPPGPGWNLKQPWGGFPSWLQLALYGVPPIGFENKVTGDEARATAADMQSTGLCAYLHDDGVTLATERQGIWRLPTTDEIVRSLVRRGGNAGCTWEEGSANAVCVTQPNKDSPLWASDQAPIYYWSADEYDEESAWYVPYTGGIKYGGVIGHQPKSWGNPRHGYRCVREP